MKVIDLINMFENEIKEDKSFLNKDIEEHEEIRLETEIEVKKRVIKYLRSLK